MIRWVSVGQEAEGVIAIGQVATGFIAVGQMATGVIAVGQVARGFVAIGQGAVGVVAIGMGSVGLVYSVGMVGVGGLGLGLVLPLVPSLGPTFAVPTTVPAARLLNGTDRAGSVLATLLAGDDGPYLRAQGRRVPVRFDARLRAAVQAAVAEPGGRAVYAHLSASESGWVCDALIDVPAVRWRRPGWWLWWGAQLAMLAMAAVFFWMLAGIPVVQALFNPGGVFFP